MKIYCFGAAREITGGPYVELDVTAGETVATLRERLVAAYPVLGELVSFAIARNEHYAQPADVIETGDELVIIPPVSGG